MACLRSLYDTYNKAESKIDINVYVTDDGCSDGTAEAIDSLTPFFPTTIIQGSGNLFWNGGMNMSWLAALCKGGYDGYLWLNDDCVVLPDFWADIARADEVANETFGKKGIYVGATCDSIKGELTYGGFVYTNKVLLIDELICPDGCSYQSCCCAHGNITYISHQVVEKLGVLCEEYLHGGGDHDYTYLAYKAGFPILVMPHYAGICDNDHNLKLSRATFEIMLHIFDRASIAGENIILESNFRESELDRLTALARQREYEILSLLLTADTEILYRRYLARIEKGRHRVHLTTGFDDYEGFVSYVLPQRKAPQVGEIINICADDFSYQSDSSLYEKIESFLGK